MGKKHLSELTLSSIVNASAVGHPTQVVQCVHTGREVGITHRLHCRFLKWSGKVYMLCDTVRSSESYVSGKEQKYDSIPTVYIITLGMISYSMFLADTASQVLATVVRSTRRVR